MLIASEPPASVDLAPASRWRALPWPIGMLATLLLTGCSPASILNLFVSRAGVEITRSVAYGAGPRRTLGYLSSRQCCRGACRRILLRRLLAERRQVALHLPRHGAGATRLRYCGAGLSALSRGPLSRHFSTTARVRCAGPATMRRVSAATRKNFLSWAIPPALISRRCWRSTADGSGKSGLDPDRDLAGLIGVSGPYDFLPLRDETLKVIFGGADRPATQPIAHVSAGSAAFAAC